MTDKLVPYEQLTNPARFSLTYEEWLEDAIADPEAYGLTKESALESKRVYLAGLEVTKQEDDGVVGVVAFWNGTNNVFGIRGTGSRYARLHAFLDTLRTEVCTSSDFPWSYHVFFEEADELAFIQAAGTDLYEDEESPPHEWARPKEPEGYVWCGRCRKLHERGKPWPEQEAEIIALLTQEIADAIDAEILEDILRLGRKTD